MRGRKALYQYRRAHILIARVNDFRRGQMQQSTAFRVVDKRVGSRRLGVFDRGGSPQTDDGERVLGVCHMRLEIKRGRADVLMGSSPPCCHN